MIAGPLMVGIEGLEIAATEVPLLEHAAVSGVLLFARNYDTPSQLRSLCDALHAVQRPTPLLVAVDQEGGRVQRFTAGFTRLPSLGSLGELYDTDPHAAKQSATEHAMTLGRELREHGIDFSFAPVLDRRDDRSGVIGARAFHASTEVIIALSHAYLDGFESVGMAAVGKHFPGHGAVLEDSHAELPVDPRPIDEIRATELKPFAALGRRLPGMLAAHVCYPALDESPASFSSLWLQGVLREELGFAGAVFSDDLGMGAATGLGDVASRVSRCLEAGCDVALACNESCDSMLEIADTLGEAAEGESGNLRAGRLKGMFSAEPSH